MGLHSLEVLHQEETPPEHLALKARGAYVQESQRAVGNKDTIFKGFKTQHRGSNLKGAWFRPTF